MLSDMSYAKLGYSCLSVKKNVSSGFILNRIMRRCLNNQSSTTNDGNTWVMFQVRNKVGIVTLNRPKSLNAFDRPMLNKIYAQLLEWQSSGLSAIVIRGSGGKAFCAGGDIKSLMMDPQLPIEKRPALSRSLFFRDEYRLDNLTSKLNIPYLALIDGVTMGGGGGLSVHGPYRVATEKTLYAMPETKIGLIPDVGSSYFLPKLQGQLGMFLGLTGHRIKGIDCLTAGIATHMCPSTKIDNLLNDIIDLPNHDTNSVQEVLGRYTQQFTDSATPVHDDVFCSPAKIECINRWFDGDSIEAILANLEAETGQESAWAKKIVETLMCMSPTMLKVTHRLLHSSDGKKCTDDSLEKCLQMEYRIVLRCTEENDFFEGVRALLVDKDNSPKWNPDKLSDVSEKRVDSYFAPLSPNLELTL